MGHAAANLVARLEDHEASPTRDEVISRYRRMRAISRAHTSAATDRLPRDAILRQARRLGLAHGRTFVVDDFADLVYALDLTVYTTAPDRLSGIERYSRSAKVAAGSDEALVLQAMRSARFSILQIEGRGPVAGLIAKDAVRDADLWLMDEGMEASLPAGAVIATRIYQVGYFWMTAGVFVMLEPEILAEAIASVPCLARRTPAEAIDDRRFAEAIYRAALLDGATSRARYQDVPDEVSRPGV
ncbi:hypothetical protein [Phenylobacterium sp.]|uniref:hypothetical protein n=1 Tax=Phenylobacterium sp. TaxID=1871053 RepID=UPI0025EACA28|nr:hypothetical protein [Phenylobacterium sp.]